MIASLIVQTTNHTNLLGFGTIKFSFVHSPPVADSVMSADYAYSITGYYLKAKLNFENKGHYTMLILMLSHIVFAQLAMSG